MSISHIRTIVEHHNNLYEVLRVIPEHNFANKDNTINLEALKAWQDYLGGDKTLRRQNQFEICKLIQEVEYIESA